MTPENARMDPALERAISEICEEALPDEVVNAAAERVWSRLAQPAEAIPQRIETCADFQALIPDFRARRLPEGRALLLEDHLHECVACRHVFEGKVVPMPVGNFPKRTQSTSVPRAARWAVAAGILATGGLVAWFTIVQFAGHSGRAIVQSVNGTLYEVSADGIRVMSAGEVLPDGVEIRTARDSSAMLALRDGSLVEMRERSDFSTSQSVSDVTVHLGHGSIIVQAAKRRTGHLYVATADCRVAVTGTVFGVSAGVKGSRVSVVQGEVHVSQDNHEHVLYGGDQLSTSASLEPVNLKDDFAWSHNPSLLHQLAALRENLNQLHMPQVRYSSRLVGLLPASTIFYASIPNLAEYLGEARNLFRQRAEESPELRAWMAGPGAGIVPVLDKLKAANEYLGDEIAVFGVPNNFGPVFLAEVKHEGFPEFLKKSGLPVTVEMRGNLALFSMHHDALATVLDSGFQHTPFYARIAEAYRQGAGLLLCADLEKLSSHPVGPGMRYLVAEQREIAQRMETRADIGFDGPRAGIASWLGPPAPMGALDYISPEASFVMAFAITNPAAILDQVPEFLPKQEGSDVHTEIAASLGGEFSLALDGQPFPVPSWKLVAEVYDQARFQAAIQKAVRIYNLRFSQETVDGRTFYTIGMSDPNPLTEAHYTFAAGYLIAAPTSALITRALQVKTNGAGIARAPGFLALLPRDHYTNASALIYQNIGTSLAPFAGLMGPKAAENMNGLKPFLIAAYGEPDRISLASTGDMLGMSLNNLLSGSVFNLANNAVPWSQVMGTSRTTIPSR